MTQLTEGELAPLPPEPRKYPEPRIGQQGHSHPLDPGITPGSHQRGNISVRMNERYNTPHPNDSGNRFNPQLAPDTTIYDGISRYLKQALQNNKHHPAEKSALTLAV
jgi:hypothetical protein